MAMEQAKIESESGGPPDLRVRPSGAPFAKSATEGPHGHGQWPTRPFTLNPP